MRDAWVITVVDPSVRWKRATAGALVREAGLPMRVAQRWRYVRRQLSPSGLKRALKSREN